MTMGTTVLPFRQAHMHACSSHQSSTARPVVPSRLHITSTRPSPCLQRRWGHIHAACSYGWSTSDSSTRRGITSGATRRVDGTFTRDFPDAPFRASSCIDYFDQWYPLGFVKDLDRSTPHRFTLLHIPLVIWYQPRTAAADETTNSSDNNSSSSSSDDSGGAWRVFSDVCPHRLVPLSEGRITADGLLECPYHGWTFNGDGGCEHIPQSGRNATPRACATTYPAVVKQGMLFVKPRAQPRKPVKQEQTMMQPQAAAAAAAAAVASNEGLTRSYSGGSSSSSSISSSISYADVPITPELEEEGWLVQDTWRDVPYDWSSLLENVLDASHVPFTHHKSISNRNVIGAYDISLTHPVSRNGFRSLWETGPRAGALGPQSSWFRPPCFMMQKIDAKENKGYESLVVVYAVPIAPGRCRLLNRNAFRFSKGGGVAAWAMKLIPGWAVHLGTQVPLEDDQIFLHLGEEQYVDAAAKGKTAAQAYYMPSPADTNVIAFRKWIEQYGGGGPFGDVGKPDYKMKLQPRQQQAQLLDRYTQHTAHCAQCQRGLKQIQTARKVLLTASRVTGMIGVLCAAAALSAAAIAAAAAPADLNVTAGGGGAAAAALMTVLGRVLQFFLLPASDSASSTAAAAAAVRVLSHNWWWLPVAAVCLFVYNKLGSVEMAFYTGIYPPPRNTDRK